MRAAPVGAPSHAGLGDVLLEWKQRSPVSDKTAFGVKGGASVPTAADDLGAGKPA